jgi:hypothetical protein
VNLTVVREQAVEATTAVGTGASAGATAGRCREEVR